MKLLLRGLLLSLVFVSIINCGSTKVYSSQKTVVHQGDIYNLTSVTKIASQLETTSPEGDVVSLKGVDKKQFQAYVAD